MKDIQFTPITVFDNYEVEEFERGRVRVTTRVVESSLNIYGIAHGGYIFTLCDQIAGMTVFSMGYDTVTLQSNINFVKGGKVGERLTIEGQYIHNGRSTKLIDTQVTNEQGQLVAKASFTMFVTGTR